MPDSSKSTPAANGGRSSRKRRILELKAGSWGSSSTDFAVLAKELYGLSKAKARQSQNGNWSLYTLAGIPLLISSLKCLIVEAECSLPRDQSVLRDLTENDDFVRMLKRYGAPDQLRDDALNLYEIRNEIMHPAHLPTETYDNWPDYLRDVKVRGLLNTKGSPSGDYGLFGQMSSHRLFTWACHVVFEVARVVVESQPTIGKRKRLEHFPSMYEFYDGCDGAARKRFLESVRFPRQS